MATDDLALEEFGDSTALNIADEGGDKSAADLATVFDVPVNISAVLGKAHMSVAAARVLASAAFDRFPRRPLEAAIEQLGQEIDASPRLLVRASGLDEATRAHVEALCADAGFSGLIAFREDVGAPAAAFTLEWADGRAEFDPEGVAARVSTALEAALAAEAGHAESLDRSAF